MIPSPQGFAVVLEPVDRQKIEELEKKLEDSAGGFGTKTITGYDTPCLLRVVAAGPGMQFEGGFIPNHIHVGDIILGTITEMNIAKNFVNPKEHWTFDGKSYIVINTRDYHDVTASTLFVVSKGT